MPGEAEARPSSRLTRWRLLRGVEWQVLSAAAVVGGLTLAGKAAGLVKELVFAYRFGRGDDLDAYLVAILLPTFLVNVLTAALVPAFLPIFLETEAGAGPEQAGKLLGEVTSAGLLIVGGLTLMLTFLLPLLLPGLAGGFGPSKLALTRRLAVLVMPIVLLNVPIALWAGVLNARGRFAFAAVAPSVVPLAVVAMLLLGPPSLGIRAAAAGLLAGTGLQCAALGWAVRRLDIPMALRLGGDRSVLMRVARQYLPAVGGTVLMSSAVVVDQAMAARLAGGSVAALNYGNKIPALAIGLGAIGLGTVMLPHFGRLAARRDWSQLRRSVRSTSRAVWLFSAPLAVALIALSPLIVRLIYQRGAFQASDTALVWVVQALLLLQIPFHLGGIVFVRLVSALQRNAILFWGAAISLPLNIVLNYLFMRWWGVAGIALSTSCVYLVSFGFLYFMSRRALTSVAGSAQGNG